MSRIAWMMDPILFAKTLNVYQTGSPGKIVLFHVDAFFCSILDVLPDRFTKSCLDTAITERHGDFEILSVQCENVWYYIFPSPKVPITVNSAN